MFGKAYKQVNDFVPMDTKSSRKKAISKKRAGERSSKESAKRQKIEDDAKKAELKACLEIVPGDDSAVNIESLATKYPIVDWKTHILAEDKMYYQIIRADGSTKYYKIFSAILDDFDRQDVLDLYRTQLTDYGFHFDKIPMYFDSKAAITISCNPVQHSRTKHIDVRYHFIKEKVENSIVELFFVGTEYQLADMFTKALSQDRFQYLVRRTNMRCLTPDELEVLANESV
ncbi:hypothetical protein Tco_0251774 [Tanacetum coccineum]